MIVPRDPHEPITPEMWEALEAAWPSEAGTTGSVSAVLAWEHHRDRLADALGRLRRRYDVDEYDHILADRAAASLVSIDALVAPTAADLVRAGWAVDQALEEVDRHYAQLARRMGGPP